MWKKGSCRQLGALLRCRGWANQLFTLIQVTLQSFVFPTGSDRRHWPVNPPPLNRPPYHFTPVLCLVSGSVDDSWPISHSRAFFSSRNHLLISVNMPVNMTALWQMQDLFLHVKIRKWIGQVFNEVGGSWKRGQGGQVVIRGEKRRPHGLWLLFWTWTHTEKHIWKNNFRLLLSGHP